MQVNLLMKEYAERRSKNPRYSERAFAKSVGLSPGFLKLYFQGKRALSPKRAKEIAELLGWTELATATFLETLGGSGTRQRTLPSSHFIEISDWYHFALIELLKTPGKWNLAKISKALGLTNAEVQYSLGALRAHELIIEKNGFFAPAAEDYVVPAASSSAVRKFHRQTLERAVAAIESQTFAERDLRSLTLAFPKERKEEASVFIQKFVADFEKKFGRGSRDSVYQLNLAFYRIYGGEK